MKNTDDSGKTITLSDEEVESLLEASWLLWRTNGYREIAENVDLILRRLGVFPRDDHG